MPGSWSGALPRPSSCVHPQMACGEWMLGQEAMELGREIAVGLSKAGLLLGASPVPVRRLVQPG